MINRFRSTLRVLVPLLGAASVLLAGCERPPVKMVQHGYRGTGMDEVYNPRAIAKQAAVNQVPDAIPAVPAGGPAAAQVYQNVKVLTDLGVGDFTRLMVAMTNWVAPQQGCTYCHEGANFASDAVYTKVVARKMLQMTRKINSDWKTHVAETGVTCYTCHRGNNIPSQIWFKAPEQAQAKGMLGNKAQQNSPNMSVALASLPYDPFTPFLSQANEIRVIGTTALPAGNRHSTKQGEWTYGLMMHMSSSLGVNCTYCHNTRSFAEWDGSTPQRGVAWYGIRMVRDINNNYMEPIASVFPAHRLGTTGDVAKANCATCHQGAYKPLYGVSMLKDYPQLAAQGAALGAQADAAPAAPADAASAAPVAAATPTPAPAPAAAATVDHATVFFGVGSAKPTADSTQSLDALIQALAANTAAKVTVSGYHSAAGSLAQNQELAKQRAFAVRDLLAARGIAAERVVLEKPQSAEANLSGEDPKSRRVELAVK